MGVGAGYDLLYADPVRKVEIEMFESVMEENFPLFDFFDRTHPSLCMTDRGRIFSGLAQITASMACAKMENYNHRVNSRVLFPCKDPEHDNYLNVLNVSKDDKGNPCLKSYGFILLDSNDTGISIDSLKIRHFLDRLRVDEKYLDTALCVQVVKDGSTLKDYIAGYLAAGELGVGFKTSPEIRRRCEREFIDLLKGAITEEKHGEFFRLFDGGLNEKKQVFKSELIKDVKRIIESNREVPEMKELSPDEMDNGMGY